MAENSYLEFDLRQGADARTFAVAFAQLAVMDTLSPDVNVVLGIRPELWAEVTGGPASAESFRKIAGDDIVLPETQHDAWCWISGGSRHVVFDSSMAAISALAEVGTLGSEVNGWRYRSERDLTGFIDGTENPNRLEAASVAATDNGDSIVLVQQWEHLAPWRALSDQDQERVIGRSKQDSSELPEFLMPADSHVSRTVLEVDGDELQIYRRNTAYGSATSHGTMFVGFCATQAPLSLMLQRMVGIGDGVRDALTLYTQALTGAYYVVPAMAALDGLVSPSDAGQTPHP